MLPTAGQLAGLAAALALPAGAENLQVTPGKWEVRTESRNSMMPQPKVHTRTDCVTDSEWDADTLMKDTDGCEVNDVESSASELSWNLVCTHPGGRMTGRAVYRSSGEKVDGSMKMSMNAQGMNVTMDMTFDARRVGDCD